MATSTSRPTPSCAACSATATLAPCRTRGPTPSPGRRRPSWSRSSSHAVRSTSGCRISLPGTVDIDGKRLAAPRTRPLTTGVPELHAGSGRLKAAGPSP
jgi:hypothetical protein